MTYNLIRDKYSTCQFNHISTNIDTAVLSRQDQNMNIYRIVEERRKNIVDERIGKYEMTYNFIRKVEREEIV